MIPLLVAASKTIAETDADSGLLDLKTTLLVAVTAVLLLVTYKLLGMHRRIEALETASPFSKLSAPVKSQEAIPAHTIAAITAAVHTTLTGRHRILAIGEPQPERQAWSVEGRRQVFQSHRVR